MSGELTEGYVSRLNLAAKTILETAVRAKDWYPQGYMGGVHGAYEGVLNHLQYQQYKDVPVGLSVSLSMGIRDLYKGIDKAIDNTPIASVVRLYASTAQPDRWENLVAEVSSIVYESLQSFANSFQGHADPNWHHAISVFQDIFPVYGGVPVGFDPLQQRLAIMLIEKLRQNMEGWYPAISRVLLAVIGPYERRQHTSRLTAFGILRDAVYKELMKLKALYAAKPDRFQDYLPDNVKYDRATNTLTFSYLSGGPATTNLDSLQIDNVDLLSPRYHRWTPETDGMGWTF